MAKPKPKPIGTLVDVPEGALVVRPGGSTADAKPVTGGVYVLDVPGVHTIDGTEYEAADVEPEAQPKP